MDQTAIQWESYSHPCSWSHYIPAGLLRVHGFNSSDVALKPNSEAVSVIAVSRLRGTWRDARQVWGLNFSNKEEAVVFANSMNQALETLSAGESGTLPSPRIQNGPTPEELEQQRRYLVREFEGRGVFEWSHRVSFLCLL
ncbi:UNVERIFIED_CONTAM: hypothetical protein FKN15_037508 [Acipenser sinensis]